MKRLTPREQQQFEDMAKMLLHASRDAMRNRGENTTKLTFDAGNPYYCEVFGMMRALVVLNYGYLGDYHTSDIRNYRWWFEQLCQQVLKEEGYFNNTHQCDHCLQAYGKDATRRGRPK